MGFDNSAMRYVKQISDNPEMAHRKILERVIPGSTVLEFGPASGVMTKYLKEEKDCHVSIIEIDQDAFEIAMQFAEHGICSDAQTFEWLEEYKDCRFDYILFIDILEHLTKAEEVLEKSSGLLKDDGSVLISVPNAAHNSVIIQMMHNQLLYQDTGILDYTHVHQFTFFELIKMCDESGYKPVYLDATYIAVGKNEFDISYMDIHPKVAEYLRKRPLGEAYQFIAEIKKKTYLDQVDIKIEDALGFDAKDYSLDDDLLESLALIRASQAERSIKALSDSPNKHLVYNEEIERLRLQINDMYEANKELPDNTRIVQINYDYQEEVRAKNNHIRILQSNIDDLKVANRKLDSELEKQGELIRCYQEEEEKRNLHIKMLDKQTEELSNRITALDEEIERKKKEIRIHQEENRELIKSNETLQDICSKAKAERDELQTELNNKQGHINLLLESDRELQRIHHSRSWKALSAWWRFRDFLVPPNSKRRLILKLIGKFIRHPVWCLKRVDRDHVRKFSDGIKNGSIMSTSQRLDNYLGGSTEGSERPDQFPLVEYAGIEDVPQLHIPVSDHPDVSIVIPVYNQFAYTYACLKSIAKNSGEASYEVIIADDCSTDLTQYIEKRITGIRVVRNKENLRFLLNCNNAAKRAKGKYILFLNNDTQVMENWLQPLIDLIEQDEKVGMVGSKLIYPDGRLQEAGGILWKDGSAWNYGHLDDPTKPEYNYVKEVDYISGAAIMVRTDLWKKLGGFDEHFAPAYCEDSDLAFRVRNTGYKVLFQPQSVVIHFEGISNGTDTSGGQKSYQIVNTKKFCMKWKEVLEKEHNPNGVNPFLARDRSLHRKTMLFVDHYVPQYDKDAGSRTVFAYIRMFVRAGYNIKFIGDNFFPHQPYTSVLQQMGVEVLFGNWYAQHWKEWLTENAGSFDYVFLNRPHIAVKYMDLIREKTNAKILYYGHDLHFLRCRREYEVTGNKKLLNDAEDWKEKEFSLMHKADITAYPSDIEIEEIHRLEPGIPAIAIPAYIYDDADSTEYKLSERNDLFFIGGYTHGPNVDAVKWFVGEILPIICTEIPGIRIHLAGSNMPQELMELASEHVVIDGQLTDEQLEEFYHKVRLNVVPLRYGAGIKGKIVESMRYGLPVVTTSCGAEGIIGAESVLIIGNTAEEIAHQIISVYNNEKELQRMSEGGKQYVLSHYSEKEAINVMKNVFDLSSVEETK